MQKKTLNYLILISIILIGAALRFSIISNYSLWNDELESLRISSYSSISEMYEKAIIPDVHPPLYQILLYYVIHYLGNSEFLLRLPSAVAGILSIYFIFLLGKRIFSDDVGILSAAFTAFLLTPIYYSIEARSYSMMLLLVIWQALLVLKIFELSENRQKYRSPFLLLFLLLLNSIAFAYTHYFGLIFVVLSNIFLTILFIKQKKFFKYLTILNLLFFVSYIPYISTLLNHYSIKGIWIKKPNLLTFGEFYYFASGFSVVFLFLSFFILMLFLWIKYKQIKKSNGGLSFKQMISLFLNIRNYNKENKKILILLLWIFIPFILAFIFSLISTPILTHRNLIILLPAVYIILSFIIYELHNYFCEKYFNLEKNTFVNKLNAANPFINKKIATEELSLKLWIFSTIIILIINLFLFSNYFNLYIRSVEYFGKKIPTICKQQSREVIEYADKQARIYPNYTVLGTVHFKSYFEYYIKKESYNLRIDDLVRYAKDSTKINEAKAGIILISLHLEPEKELLEFINKGFQTLEQKDFRGAKIWIFKKL